MKTKQTREDKVQVITLGCSKNLVDSENLITQLEANEFAKAAKKLSRRIDDAMGELMDEWAEQAPTINEEIQALNEKLTDAKEQLDKKVDKATKLTDAIGYLDDLALIARLLLKP